jgi:23S rRNA (uracil1939-C5)-methyltransferase
VAKSPARSRFIKPRRKAGHGLLWGKDIVEVDGISQEGRGVARREGKVVFVSDALQGERVRVQCTMVKRDYDQADMLELAEGSSPSAERVKPPCAIYGQCGGCSLQHLSIAAQRQHKEATLLAMLQQAAPGLVADEPISGKVSGFRHRLRVVVTWRADTYCELALRQRGSHNTTRLSSCHVANSAVNGMLRDLPVLLSRTPRLRGLREIDIDSDSQGDIGLCFYFAAKPGEGALKELQDAVMAAPVVAMRARVASARKRGRDDTLSDTDGDTVAPWQELYADGELSLALTSTASGISMQDSLRLAYQPGDFTQTNWEVNSALVERALEWLQPGTEERALDLFSGIGNFALPLARRAGSVHAIEGDAGMTARVTSNAARNGIENLHASTLNLMANEITLPKADIALIDPPRAGARAVCEALAQSGVQRLVYISCHPATLLRDARLLVDAGYSLVKAAAVDMFPHTGHSEALALFERRLR